MRVFSAWARALDSRQACQTFCRTRGYSTLRNFAKYAKRIDHPYFPYIRGETDALMRSKTQPRRQFICSKCGIVPAGIGAKILEGRIVCDFCTHR